MKHDMINISLPRYGTRMLQAGDPFECSRREARVLAALKKARYATDEDRAAAAEPDAPAQQPQGDGAPAGEDSGSDQTGAGDEQAQALAAARADYQAAFNKRPYHGWSAGELRQKISAGAEGGA